MASSSVNGQALLDATLLSEAKFMNRKPDSQPLRLVSRHECQVAKQCTFLKADYRDFTASGG
jgi:hypothetical protein